MSADKFEHVHHRRRTIFVNNFIGGIAWGLGATVGLAVILAALGILLRWVDFVPVVGDFAAGIVDYVEKK